MIHSLQTFEQKANSLQITFFLCRESFKNEVPHFCIKTVPSKPCKLSFGLVVIWQDRTKWMPLCNLYTLLHCISVLLFIYILTRPFLTYLLKPIMRHSFLNPSVLSFGISLIRFETCVIIVLLIVMTNLTRMHFGHD